MDCDVNVTWIKPVDNGCPLTMYSLYYREIQSHETRASWQEVRISDNLKTHYVLPLRCDTQYVIEMSAWNELGQSNRSRRWNIKTNSGKFPRIKYLDPFVCFVRVEGMEDALYSNFILELKSACKMALLQIFCHLLSCVRAPCIPWDTSGCEFNGWR